MSLVREEERILLGYVARSVIAGTSCRCVPLYDDAMRRVSRGLCTHFVYRRIM